MFITARPEQSAWLTAITNAKVPPVMTQKITEVNSFPLNFILDSTRDGTPEGLASSSWLSDNVQLALSARLDTDGSAMTRNPEDLVGRGITKRNPDGGWQDVTIELVGRGIGGKIVTATKQ